MPRSLLHFRLLIISPSDVEVERRALTDAVIEWNAHAGRTLGVSIDPVRWESHSRPALGARPQQIINNQIVDDCDFGIAVFWSRLGTPTGGHASGSAEEIERLLTADKDVMVYLKAKAIPQDSLGDDQFLRLQKFKSELSDRGVFREFDDATELTRYATLHLTSLVSKILISREPGALASSKRKTPAERATDAIRHVRADQELATDEYLDSIRAEIDRIRPKEVTAESLATSLEEIVPLVREFHSICNVTAAVASIGAAERIYDAFGAILKRYKLSSGFTGRYTETDFDFDKFIGHELFVTFVSSLLKRRRWKILEAVLNRELYSDEYSQGCAFYGVSAVVRLLEDLYRSQGGNWISPQGQKLKERHEPGGVLAGSPSFPEFMDADYFLFVHGIVQEPYQRWMPWTATYLRDAPRFLCEARRMERARELASVFRVCDVSTLVERLKVRASWIGQSLGGYRQRHPLARFDIDLIGSQS